MDAHKRISKWVVAGVYLYLVFLALWPLIDLLAFDYQGREVGRDVVTVISSGFVAQAGDANRDGEFNQLDIALALQADKYQTGEPASFAEGDWSGDGLFDREDIVAALQTGNYLQGPYISYRAN